MTFQKFLINTRCALTGNVRKPTYALDNSPNIPEKVEHWTIISPKRLTTTKGDCPYYRSNIKASYAKGFIGILESLPHKQMENVIIHLMSFFSRRTYYRVRKGERLLSPAEQQQVLNVLKYCGVLQPPKFDEYIEAYDW